MGRGLATKGSLFCEVQDKCAPVTSHTPALVEWEGLLGAGLGFSWVLWIKGQEPKQMALPPESSWWPPT